MTPTKYIELPLYHKTLKNLYTKVDYKDYIWLSKWKWRVMKGYREELYACRRATSSEPGATILLHREILCLKYKDGILTDHINGNTLDNRRSNIRIATAAQNSHNLHNKIGKTSKFRGVDYFPRTNRWRARCAVEGKVYNLGYYKREQEAAKVASDFRKTKMPYSSLDQGYCAA